MALGVAVWYLRPPEKLPSFDELYAHAVSLRDAHLYPEASEYIQGLFADPLRQPTEVRRLHALMTEVIFAHEKGNAVHAATNAQNILLHSDGSLPPGGSHTADGHRMRAQVLEWLKRPVDVVNELRAAVALDGKGEVAWRDRKRIVEIEKATGGAKPEQLAAAYDAFLAADDASEELRCWAAEQKVEQYEAEDHHADAEKFLEQYAGRLTDPTWKNALQYLRALAWFRAGRLDDAERLLRSVRDETVPGDRLYARLGWLLGKILETQQAPEYALGFFEDVIKTTTPNAYRTGSILGRAECLAAVERYPESLEAYREALRCASEEPYDTMVDLRVVRESATTMYQSLLTQRRLEDAMGYLRLAAKLAPPSDTATQANYTRRLAELSMALGRAARENSFTQPAGGVAASRTSEDVVRQASVGVAPKKAREHFAEAGEAYLELAKLNAMDEESSSSASWLAADAFDEAGLRVRAAQVLEAFIREQPDTSRTPMALLRLGQQYQAGGEMAKAIDRYQQNLVLFPRTPSAAASLVPLAECYLATGDRTQAEATLLRILIRKPGDSLTVITPAAAEYRDALFGLGDMYFRFGQYDKAIGRYEEALERYPRDPRADRATFLLADTCRRSAEAIRRELKDGQDVAHKDQFQAAHRERLTRARQLYDRVIERYVARDQGSLTELDRLYVKLSHFYRADVVYDLGTAGDAPDMRAFGEAHELYERAAWQYQTDPMAMAAYVQMIECQLRLGRPERARMTLQRARWALRGITNEQFREHAPAEDGKFWDDYLAFLEKTPALAMRAAG
jgi:tetratricopeptide (TPR) repeat protein